MLLVAFSPTILLQHKTEISTNLLFFKVKGLLELYLLSRSDYRNFCQGLPEVMYRSTGTFSV
jgi:hypothetical protein